MPKVYLTDTEQKCARFAAWVYGQMKIRNMSQRSLAEKLGISHQALSKKLSKRSFDFSDYLFFVNEFQPTDKELREISGL